MRRARDNPEATERPEAKAHQHCSGAAARVPRPGGAVPSLLHLQWPGQMEVGVGLAEATSGWPCCC